MSTIKYACEQAFNCGIEDVKGNPYELELTDSFYTLITALRVDFGMRNTLPHLCSDKDVVEDIAYEAWKLSDSVGGILCVEDVVEAIGNYKSKKDHFMLLKGEKMVDKRTKKFKNLKKLARCLDTFRNLGVFYACDEQDYTNVDLKRLKEDLERFTL